MESSCPNIEIFFPTFPKLSLTIFPSELQITTNPFCPIWRYCATWSNCSSICCSEYSGLKPICIKQSSFFMPTYFTFFAPFWFSITLPSLSRFFNEIHTLPDSFELLITKPVLSIKVISTRLFSFTISFNVSFDTLWESSFDKNFE